jgi:photosystem II stability/assembly factor-like uncharacterized protein
MNSYKLSRHRYQFFWFFNNLLLLLLLVFVQPPESTYSEANTLPMFAPSGHFETNFLPEGSLSVANNNFIFVYDGGLMRSDNGGATWRTMTISANIVVPSPNFHNDKIVFASSSQGFILSFDQGYTWRSPQQPINFSAQQIVVSPRFVTDRTVYVISSGELKYSTDGGDHWQTKSLPIAAGIERLILAPSDESNQTLYLHLYHPDPGEYTLWRSLDGGTNWSRADIGLNTENGNYVYDLGAVSLNANHDLLFAATRLGVFASLDQGQVWHHLSTKVFSTLLVLPDVVTTQTFLGVELTTGQLYRTTDLGITWIPQLDNYFIRDSTISAHYEVDNTIVVRSRDRLWASTDRGASWQQKSGPLSTANYSRIYQIVLSPNYENDGTLFAAAQLSGGTTDDNHLLRSNNFGQTWSIHELSGTGYLQVAISPNFSNDGVVWVTRNEQLYRSTDGGIHWTLTATLPITPSVGQTRIQLSPNYANDQTIFVNHYLQGFYRSTNNGVTWSQLATDMSEAILRFVVSPGYPSDPTIYISINNEGLYRSTNDGATWQLVNPPGFRSEQEVVLSPNFTQDNTLFVIKGAGQGVYRSTNRGNTWTDVTGPYLNYDVRSLAISPRFTQDQTIVSGRNYGPLYISEDAGATWFQMDHLTGIGGIMHNQGGLALGYKGGLLQPIAGSNGIQFYQWPTHVRPPTSLGIPMIPNSPGPTILSYSLPQHDEEIHWTASEAIPWLTASPLEGTLTTPLILTVDHTATTFPASAHFTMQVYYSGRQMRSYIVPVRAFYASHHIYMPAIER